MTPLRIFISSVQSEFAGESGAVRDYLRGDPRWQGTHSLGVIRRIALCRCGAE